MREFDAAGGLTEPAAERLVRLAFAEVPSPAMLDHRVAMESIVRRFDALPEGARYGAPAEAMSPQLTKWADELGTDDPIALDLGLRLLSDAQRIGRGEARGAAVVGLNDRRRLLAERLATDWPLDALRSYVLIERDAAAIEAADALLGTLGEGPSIWAEWEAFYRGEVDATALERIEKELARLDGLDERAGRDTKARAVAQLLRARVAARKSDFDGAAETERADEIALREAAKAWPALGLERQIAWAMASIALARARGRSPTIEEAWQRDGRQRGRQLFLHRQLGHTDHIDALRSGGELANGANSCRSKADERPVVNDWILGQLADDAELSGAARSAFSRPIHRIGLEIDVLLDPDSPRNQALAELLAAGPG